ncbi:Aldehyde/histidinol dehydrogenase [Leucosporidium creatinivorum]|uniref:Aldehyde dehydrogenase n=1 Tax=Leucosporidium creatinivorum TaxID=106004 RepID=A0A1Y2FXT5_9BASI|nr:Aldehyde/histidinol dehydrogenase [Leucosporidium creatinivorum]
MESTAFTSLDQIDDAYTSVVEAKNSYNTRSISYRKAQIKQLGWLLQNHEKQFEAAVLSDLGRPAFETISAELNPMKAEINEAYSHLDKWAKPRKVKTSMVWGLAQATVYPEPKGVALIIGTWNFPIVLTLGPLLGAIAAGNSAILKPAEQAPATAALLASLIPKYLDNQAYKVVLGAVEQTTKLLELKFDHIFYTGSGNIGKIIARAAAEHLTPITLELGGKSPAIVFDDANIDVVGRRIMWGKYTNAGQICIAPDYVLTTREMQPKLLESFRAALAEFNPPPKGSSTSEATPLVQNKSYSKIVSSNHFNRISKLLDTTKGEIVIGGQRDEATQKIEITVVTGVKPDDALMESEIFGPILPILVVDSADDMVKYINAHDNPLAIYVFTQARRNRDYIFERTRSGGFVHNDVLVQFQIPGLPFGGHGPSGMGNYHGKASFDTFSHERASASIPTWMDVLLASRYPPYTPQKLKMLMLATKATIKKEGASFGLGATLKVIAVVVALVAGFKKLQS